MDSTNEKIETVTETEVADAKIAYNETAEAEMSTEMLEEKSSTTGPSDNEKATEYQSVAADESSLPEFRSQTPTELFAAAESSADLSVYPTQPVTYQPTTVHPIGHHVQVHPAPVVAVVPSVAPVIHTSCCECDGPWCHFCWCGICAHTCTGLTLNQKITGDMGIWRVDIFVSGIIGILFLISLSIALLNEEFKCFDNFGCYWQEGNGKAFSIIAFVSVIILFMMSLIRLYARFAQRRSFLQNQAQKGHYPNNEGCIASFCCTWFCSPCLFGQMNSAIEKQRFLSLPQQQHTVSHNV